MIVLHGREILFVGLFHSYAALMTNISLGMTSASQTHMIKMSEPLVTTMLMSMMGKIYFNWNILLIIISILINAFGSEPFTNLKASTAGILMALGSNVFFALRNVKTKYAASEDQIKLTSIHGFSLLSLSGFLCLLPSYFISSFQGRFIEELQTTNAEFLILSSVCHVIYNAVSLTLVLSMFDPLQHAFLNIAKRVSIVLIFYVFVQQEFAPFNTISAAFCLIVCVLGTKIVKNNQTR